MDSIYIPIIESLIFASDEPLNSNEIINVIKGIDGDEIQITKIEIENLIDELNNKYISSEFYPFKIMKIAEGFLYTTKPEHSKYIGFLSSEKSKRKLSQASLETLAIIAYKQPITKPEIEAIRGVNSDYIIASLLEKNLISINGRAESIGRPLLYGTTPDFLKYFGLNKVSDLPKPREIEEIMQDEDFLEQKRKIMLSGFEENLENNLLEENDNNKSE